MKFLIIGLGSMGQRRIRCLKALGYTDIWAYDRSADIAEKVYHKYAVNAIWSTIHLENVMNEYEFDAMLICVPPTMKQEYIVLANEFSIPCFCEADIVTYDGEYYPSRTMVYHPAVKRIKEFLQNSGLGNVYTFNYHLGQHIRDWHVGADYTNYYAAQKETGACKEMFAFELAWLSWIFGQPANATGMRDKQLKDPQVTADDVYATAVSFRRFHSNRLMDYLVGTVLIDIVSRPAIRKLTIIGEKGMMEWDWRNDYITLMLENGDIKNGTRIEGTKKLLFDKGQAQEGYNENIPEQMYVDEVAAFVKEVQGRKSEYVYFSEYGYTQHDEREVIEMLGKVEE